MKKESLLSGYIIEDNIAYCTLNESCICKSKTIINNKYPCYFTSTNIAAYYLHYIGEEPVPNCFKIWNIKYRKN